MHPIVFRSSWSLLAGAIAAVASAACVAMPSFDAAQRIVGAEFEDDEADVARVDIAR